MLLIVKRKQVKIMYYYGIPRRVTNSKEIPKEMWTEHREYAKKFSSNTEIEKTFGLVINKLEEIGFVLEQVYLD